MLVLVLQEGRDARARAQGVERCLCSCSRRGKRLVLVLREGKGARALAQGAKSLRARAQ